MRGARPQQPLNGACDDRGMPQRMQETTPNPGQPDQRCYDQQAKPTDVGRHRQPRDTAIEFSEALSNAKESAASCQVASRRGAESSTMEKGSTACLPRPPHMKSSGSSKEVESVK